MMRDPLAAALYGRATYYGPGPNEPYVPLSPAERDKLIHRLEMDRLDQICTGCGSTKPMTYYKAIGAVSCCEVRKMVPVGDYLAEMASLKAKLAKFRKRKARRATQAVE